MLSCAAFSSATCGWWAEVCMLQSVTIRSWKQAWRFQLGAIIKKEGVVFTSETRPASGWYKIFPLQQGHQGVQFSDVMGCSCKTSPENIIEVKVLSIQHCSTRTWDVIHHGRTYLAISCLKYIRATHPIVPTVNALFRCRKAELTLTSPWGSQCFAGWSVKAFSEKEALQTGVEGWIPGRVLLWKSPARMSFAHFEGCNNLWRLLQYLHVLR